jgi:hypothetical protein
VEAAADAGAGRGGVQLDPAPEARPGPVKGIDSGAESAWPSGSHGARLKRVAEAGSFRRNYAFFNTLLGRLIETITDQFGQGAQTANDLLRARAQLPITRAAITVDSLKADAEHVSKLSKLNTQEERAVAFQIIQVTRRQRNIENVIALAGEELRDTPDDKVGDKKVDPDWTTQFFNGAQDVSNEDMQKIWAKLLAGEIKKPGTFRLRTLERVKELSKDDAETFGRICTIVWHGLGGETWAFTDQNWVHAHAKGMNSPLTFDYVDCLAIEECGLISITEPFGTVWMPPSGFYLHYFGEGYFFSNENIKDETTNIGIGTFHLTSAGRELSQVATATRNEEYLQSILSLYHNRGWKIGRATPVGDNAYSVKYEKYG